MKQIVLSKRVGIILAASAFILAGCGEAGSEPSGPGQAAATGAQTGAVWEGQFMFTPHDRSVYNVTQKRGDKTYEGEGALYVYQSTVDIDGQTYYRVDGEYEGVPVPSTVVYHRVGEDGLYRWKARHSGDVRPGTKESLELPLPVTVGDTWTAALGPGEGTATAVEIATCQVPTGTDGAMETYDNCLKVVIEGEPYGTYYQTVRWYVSEVGIVKQTVESKSTMGSVMTRMVLEKYRRAAVTKAKAEQPAMN